VGKALQGGQSRRVRPDPLGRLDGKLCPPDEPPFANRNSLEAATSDVASKKARRWPSTRCGRRKSAAVNRSIGVLNTYSTLLTYVFIMFYDFSSSCRDITTYNKKQYSRQNHALKMTFQLDTDLFVI
jgi:hypothetical protein